MEVLRSVQTQAPETLWVEVRKEIMETLLTADEEFLQDFVRRMLQTRDESEAQYSHSRHIPKFYKCTSHTTLHRPREAMWLPDGWRTGESPHPPRDPVMMSRGDVAPTTPLRHTTITNATNPARQSSTSRLRGTQMYRHFWRPVCPFPPP